jgi:hypothetical protein
MAFSSYGEQTIKETKIYLDYVSVDSSVVRECNIDFGIAFDMIKTVSVAFYMINLITNWS